MRVIQDRRLIFLIISLGLILRVFRVWEVPPSLNWDEISHGYNAYSILKTAKDEWGVTFPIIFRAYGDYKLPVYIYLTVFSEYLFGVNAFSVRLPSILAGIGIIVFTYLLVNELFSFKQEKFKSQAKVIAVISSLLVAVEPWTLFISRGAFEANLCLFFLVSGIYFFLRSISSGTKFLILAMMFMGLSVWTYNSARIFTPIMLVILILVYKNEIFRPSTDRKKLWLSFLITAFFVIPMFYQLSMPAGQARYSKVAILDDGAIAQIEEARQNSSLGPFLARFVYNKPLYFTRSFLANLVSHLSWDFVFLKGGNNYQFNVQKHGLLYLVDFPFFLLGLAIFLKNCFAGNKKYLLVILWLVLGAIPSSVTRDAPHSLRSVTMLPTPMIISSFGLWWAISRAGKYLMAIYLLLLVIFATRYLSLYFGEYRINYSKSWQYGYEQLVGYIRGAYGNYQKIIITKEYGEPHEFILFYWPWDPEKYRSDQNLSRFYQSEWYWVDGFDKFYFVNKWDIPSDGRHLITESGIDVNCSNVRCLLAVGPGSRPIGWRKINEIYFLDGNVAFEVYENPD